MRLLHASSVSLTLAALAMGCGSSGNTGYLDGGPEGGGAAGTGGGAGAGATGGGAGTGATGGGAGAGATGGGAGAGATGGGAGAGATGGGAGTGGAGGAGGSGGSAGAGGTAGWGGATPCFNSLDCVATPETPVCDSTASLCVECIDDPDCGDSRERCVAQRCERFCVNSLDCAGTPATPICDIGSGTCVECTASPDCPGGGVCAAFACRPGCDSDLDCTALSQLCDRTAGYCVECLGDVDCALAQYCTSVGTCASDGCTPGTGRCEAGGLASCAPNGSTWLPPIVCGAGTTCLESAGAARCEPWACTPLATACELTAERLSTCSADGLSSTVIDDCAGRGEVCVAGACHPVVCVGGTDYCAGTEVRRCSQEGEAFSRVTDCASIDSYCSPATATCAPWVCTPGQPTCDGDTATTCNADGSAYLAGGTACGTDICVAGACLPQVCTPNARFCDTGTVRTCNATGTGSTLTQSCSSTQYCDMTTGTCLTQICTPGAGACSGNTIRTCNADGSGYTGTTTDCGADVCVAGACLPVICPAAQRFCQAGTVRQCSSNGTSSTLVSTCSSTQFCNSTTNSCQTRLCTPDQPACNGNQATTCNADGSGYTGTSTDCGSQVCLSGTCQDLVCAPNARFCQGGDVYLCNGTGSASSLWDDCTTTEYCNSSSLTCEALLCTPNQPACNGNVATTCDATGQGYVAGGTDCATQRCVSGTCQDVLFREDFEDGDFIGWTTLSGSGYTRSVSAPGANGTGLSLLQTRAGGTSSHQDSLIWTFGTGLQPTSASYWVRPEQSGAATGYVIFGVSTSAYIFWAYMDDTGNINSSAGGSIGTYTAGNWYHVELRNINWTAKTYSVYLNGVFVRSASFATTSVTSITRIDLYNFQTGSARFDEIELR